MAEPKAKGSIILKLIILIMIAVMIAAIWIPKKEWEKEAAEQELCRLHLENLYYTSLQYLKKYKIYQGDLDTLLNFIKNDSMMVPPGLFEVERLTVWESPRDSFLVGFPDDYHYQRIDWEYTCPETLIIELKPKARFTQVPPSKMWFGSGDSVFVERREKGIKDIWITVWGKSLIAYERIPADSMYIPTQYFAISESPEDFRTCPTCGLPYDIEVNVNVKIAGNITYNVLKSPGGNVAGNEFYSNLFIRKLRSDAAVAALNIFKADTTIFIAKEKAAQKMVLGQIPADTVEISSADSAKITAVRDSLITAMKDSIVIANFNLIFAGLKPNSKVALEEEAVNMVVVDSIAGWNDSERIKNRLFNAELNAEERALASTVDINSMLARLKAEEQYYIAKIDSVGLTIACPIENTYIKPDRSIFERLFGVGPVSNHGQIKNGDYSWSEKK